MMSQSANFRDDLMMIPLDNYMYVQNWILTKSPSSIVDLLGEK